VSDETPGGDEPTEEKAPESTESPTPADPAAEVPAVPATETPAPVAPAGTGGDGSKKIAIIVGVLIAIVVVAAIGASFAFGGGTKTLNGKLTVPGPCPPGEIKIDFRMAGDAGKTAGSGPGAFASGQDTNCSATFSFPLEKADNYQLFLDASTPQGKQSIPGPKYTLQQVQDANYTLTLTEQDFGAPAPPPSPVPVPSVVPPS
jgi:type 1 fimbria pilin